MTFIRSLSLLHHPVSQAWAKPAEPPEQFGFSDVAFVHIPAEVPKELFTELCAADFGASAAFGHGRIH